MPDPAKEQNELATMLEHCLEFADRLKLGLVAIKIAEALDYLRTGTDNHKLPG